MVVQQNEEEVFLGRSVQKHQNVSEETAKVIDSGEVKGAIEITHKLGGEFRMNNTSGDPLGDAGLGTSQAHSYGGFTANSSTLIDNLYVAPTGDSGDSTTGNEVVASNWKSAVNIQNKV